MGVMIGKTQLRPFGRTQRKVGLHQPISGNLSRTSPSLVRGQAIEKSIFVAGEVEAVPGSEISPLLLAVLISEKINAYQKPILHPQIIRHVKIQFLPEGIGAEISGFRLLIIELKGTIGSGVGKNLLWK